MVWGFQAVHTIGTSDLLAHLLICVTVVESHNNFILLFSLLVANSDAFSIAKMQLDLPLGKLFISSTHFCNRNN